MERSIFAFIWKFSLREQMVLLAVTVLTFPLLYATLELPKRIINDAIGGDAGPRFVFGLEFTQIGFLLVLCGAFLVAVLSHGLLKMRLNTMKGVLAERLLRRFRFQMLERMMRFPRPYFRRTSQGELVSMVTSEAEPMGGLMGDALSQPVFQAGQMATILFFLFAQSVWFGLAAVALIPLQAWLIPRLQRQINLLNKARIQEVRALAAEIGESAVGASDLRLNGGLRWRGAVFADRLGRLFGIRFDIYQKKFFMKFINNFINQLTPFFFYSVGGVLAIQGQITVGALVAALAAYKDLSSPWKELLAYYNQTADMSLRWEVVTEKFGPQSVVDESLYAAQTGEIPRLKGDIVFDDVTVRDEDGQVILEDMNLTIPQGARVAVKSENPTASAALAELLTREIVPSRGRITLGGHAFNELPQDVIARRIGYAHSEPHIFQGTLGDNLLMPFRHEPHLDGHPEVSAWVDEARRGGNPADPLGVDWVDPAVAGFDTVEEVKAWWFKLVEAMGVDEFMVRRTMRNVLRPGSQEGLRQRIVDIRPEVARRLEEAGLNDIVHRYHPDKFNPVSPLGSNLLFALPVRPLEQETLANQENFVRLMREEGVDDEILGIATGVIDGLVSTFGAGGTDHPIFRSLNLSEALFEKLAKLSAKLRMSGEPSLSDREIGLLMTVPFAFSAEKIGPIFKEEFKAKVLEVRKSSGGRMLAQLKGLFQPIREDTYLPIKTVLGNAIFGRISDMAGAREEDVIQVVVDVISEAGLRGEVAEAIWGVETSIGAENLPSVFRERVAFSRAAIKRPDILVLRNALASHDAESRSQTRARLRGLMPDTTKVFIEKEFFDTSEYDLTVEISDGRIDGVTRAATDDDSRTDLAQKLQMIAKADLFAKLDRQSQRLLAFSAQWYKAKAGQVIFREGQPPDAAYLCVKGEAAIYYPDRSMRAEPITQVTAGRLVGDLAIILDRARVLDLEAQSDCVFLRIPGPELRTVIESDVRVATSLLETVAGHLVDAGGAVARASQGQSRYAGSAPEDGNGGIGDDAGGGAGAPSRPEPTREPEPQ